MGVEPAVRLLAPMSIKAVAAAAPGTLAQNNKPPARKTAGAAAVKGKVE